MIKDERYRYKIRRINAKLRKINAKMISILNKNGLRNSTFAKSLKKENKLIFGVHDTIRITLTHSVFSI